MANENDGLYISASLDIPVTEQNIKTNDIPKINSDLASDQNAKIKLNAEVDYNKVKSNVQNQLNSMASKLKLNVDSVSIDTNKVVEPLRKGFKQLFTEISSTKLVDTNVMVKNVKEMFGVNNTKEIKQAYDDLKQTLALNPNDMKAIMQSYTNLSSTILDGVSLDKEFDTSYLGLNKIYNKVFECATAFNEVTTNTKTTEKQIVSTSEKSVNELNKLKVKTDELKNQFNTPLKSVNGITTQFDTSSLDVVKEAKKSFEDLFSGTSSKFSTNINSTIGDNGIKKVQNFTIQVKSATGEVEKFKYVLTNIGNQIQPDFKYVLQNINEADEGVLRLQDAQSKFDSKVQSTITSLKTQAEILQTSYTDSNSSKYVKNQANIDDLNKEYKNTISVIENLKTASNTTFESMKADATSSIEKLRNLINLTNRAENPATSLRKKDIETNKSVYGENIDRLVSQLNNLKSAEPILTILKTDIENVRNALSGVTDASGFEKFLNQFDILDAKAKRLKTLFNGYGSATWFSDNKEQISSISDVSAKAKIYQAELKRLTDEWKSQGIYVDDVKQKASELSRVIGKIKNPEIFEKRTSEFDTLVTATKQVKTNLDEQVVTYQKIYDLETKIARLNSNPERNATSIANYSTQLAEQKQRLSNLQMQSNAYKNVISLEEQERIVLSAVTKEQEKLNVAKAKATDTSRVNTEKETVSIEKYRQKIDKLIITLELLKQANSKAMSGKFDYELQADSLIAQLQSLQNQKDIPLKELKTGFDNCNASANKLKNTLQVTGKTGASAFDTLKEKVVKFSSWMGITTTVSYLANTVRNAVNELKDLDTILTEISKTSDRTDESLRNLGNNAFDEASALGQKATDYLSGVQEASRAGFDEKGSENMAKLSVLAQSAGDMTSELANQYLIATNAAYKFSGDTEKLNAVLDSQNYITNHNALNMTDLAEATKIAASQASAAGIKSDKLTAAIGTMIATTQQGGDIAGRAFKGILMNLQQIKGTADDIGDGGADITTESLSKYEKACADLGVSLKEVKNGTLQLRDPMQILSELSSAVSKESENSVKVANLINAVGGKYRGNQLTALLKNWDVYSKMLSEYNSQDAVGSAMEEAQKTANSWEGQLNKLSNTWTKFVQNFVDTDFVKTGISGVSSFIDILDKLIQKFGILGGVITPIVTTVMTVKNKGITDIFNSFKSSEKYKSIETGLFGTSKVLSTEDVASLKNYNKLLEQGKSSTEAFDIALSNGSQSVKNMAINAAGSTVKLKTMTVAERAAAVGAKLMGSALKIAAGFLIGIAIDGLITWIDNVVHAEEKAKEKLEELYTQSKETTQKNLDEVKSLQENLATYQELSKKVSLTAQDKETLLSIQNDLINKYGIEAKNIDLLTGKYKENNAELEKIIVNKAKDALISAKTEYSTAKSSANNITNGEELYSFQEKREDFGDMSGIIDRYADMIQESTNKVATRTRSAAWRAMGQMFPWGNVSDDVTISLQKDLSLKDQIIAIQDILDGLNKNTDEYEKTEPNYIALTTSLNEKLKERQEIFDKINEALGDIAKAQIAVYQANNPIDTENITETQYNEWKDNLLSQFKDDPDLQSVIQSQLETTYADLEVKFDVKPSQDSNMFDITQYSEDIDNLQTKVKSLKETLSKLKDGSITQDELIDFTQEYGLTEYLDDLPELQKQIEKLLKTSPDDLINALSELRDNVDETDAEKITELIIVLRQLGSTSESVDSVSESIQRLEDEISAIDEQLSKLNDEKKSLEDTISTIESNNSNIVSAYEYQVDKVIDKLQDEVDVHQRIVDKYEAKNELLEDENDKLQDQADIIQEILDNYDTSSNVVQNFIDKQIDSLEERKSKIQEENDSLNETINLEEKLNNLRNAKRKRVRIYNEQGGWQLGEDTSAVQSAEKEYRDAVTDKKTSDIDKQIEGWKNYAQQWSDTVDNINNKQNELTANEILGSDWRKKITNKDIGILKKFGSEYTNYKNKLENNINAKIKKNEADIKKNEEVIKTENKVIKSKNAVIDKWQEYKNKLSDFVDETSKKSNEYINSLSNVTLSEKSSYSDRTKFFNDYKQALVNGYKEISDAKAQLDGVENTIGSLEYDKKNKENQKSKLENQQKSGTTTKKQYKLVNTKTGSIVGTSENKKSLEKAKADLNKTLVEKTIRKQFANVPEPTRSKAIKSLIDEYTADDKAIEEYLKLYKLNNKYVIKSYSTGGTVDYTGLANVHGSKSNSEVIFNSAQAKKLYDFIANTGNLSEVIGRQVAQDLGNKTINNIVNNNDKADNSKTNITIRVDKIVTPNANDFMNQMTNLIRQSNRNRMVGK